MDPLRRSMKMRGTMAMIGLVAGLLAAGCTSTKSEKTASAGGQPAMAQTASAEGRVMPVNTMCPLGKHEFSASTRTAETSRSYNGSTIGFCCEDCAQKFDTMSAAQKDQVLAAARANKPL
jgi:YHS domain-containing protein